MRDSFCQLLARAKGQHFLIKTLTKVLTQMECDYLSRDKFPLLNRGPTHCFFQVRIPAKVTEQATLQLHQLISYLIYQFYNCNKSMKYDQSLCSGSQKMLFSRASIITSLYTGLCYYTKNMLSETMHIYGEMAKNHLCTACHRKMC